MTCVTRVDPAVRRAGGWGGQDAEWSMPSDFSLQEPQPYFGGGGGVEWAQQVDALCGREQGPGKLVPAGESTGTAVNLSRHFRLWGGSNLCPLHWKAEL